MILTFVTVFTCLAAVILLLVLWKLFDITLTYFADRLDAIEKKIDLLIQNKTNEVKP